MLVQGAGGKLLAVVSTARPDASTTFLVSSHALAGAPETLLTSGSRARSGARKCGRRKSPMAARTATSTPRVVASAGSGRRSQAPTAMPRATANTE